MCQRRFYVYIKCKQENYNVDVEGEVTLLWVLREQFKIDRDKYGCGAGVCGACTV